MLHPKAAPTGYGYKLTKNIVYFNDTINSKEWMIPYSNNNFIIEYDFLIGLNHDRLILKSGVSGEIDTFKRE